MANNAAATQGARRDEAQIDMVLFTREAIEQREREYQELQRVHKRLTGFVWSPARRTA